jgi:hypothetical protein
MKQYHPWKQLRKYMEAAGKRGLSGVHKPFWRDWPHSNPACFFTPDALHQWHMYFGRYDFTFAQKAFTNKKEFDLRYSALQPIVGRASFGTGVTHLKKVTGRARRDMQRYFMPILDGLSDDFQRYVCAAVN